MGKSDETRCKEALKRKRLPVTELRRTWITGAEAEAYLNCSRRFLEKLRAEAEITWAKIGGTYYHELASIEQMFDRHKITAKKKPTTMSIN